MSTQNANIIDCRCNQSKSTGNFGNLEILRRSIFNDVEDLKFMVYNKTKMMEKALQNNNLPSVTKDLGEFKCDFRNRTK